MSRALFCAVCLGASLAAAGCGGSGGQPPSTPNPGPEPGVVPISGSERLGWDQPAATSAELATIRYLAYVDGAPVELQDVSCASTPGATGFACSSRLPSMTTGTHTIELAAFVDQDGRLESGRSTPLRVRLGASVVLATSGAAQADRPVVTIDGVRLRATIVATGINDATDLAVAPDGRVFIAERSGRVRVFHERALAPPAAALADVVASEGGGLLSLAVDPDFEQTGALYLAYTADVGYRLARFRVVGAAVEARVILMDGVPAAADRPGATLRIGPDRKLYLALDDGGDPRVAGDLGSFSGKVLRFNADGTTPADQAGGTPVFSLEVNRPAGLDWGPDDTLWVAETDADGVDRLQAVTSSAPRRRGSIARRYSLPPDLGASNLAFYWSAAIPALRGDLLVAADTAQAILRVRLDPGGTVTGTEWLLRERIGAIRAIGVAPDGGIYVCTPESLWLITADE